MKKTNTNNWNESKFMKSNWKKKKNKKKNNNQNEFNEGNHEYANEGGLPEPVGRRGATVRRPAALGTGRRRVRRKAVAHFAP